MDYLHSYTTVRVHTPEYSHKPFAICGGLGGTEFLGTHKNIFLYRGRLVRFYIGPKFFPIRDFYILPK